MRFSAVAATLALPLLAVATPWGTPTTIKAVRTCIYVFPTNSRRECMFTNNYVLQTTVTVTETSTPTVVNQCSTGSVQCCNSVQQSNAGGLVGLLLGLLDVVLDVVVPIGITCSPITVIGVSGTSWSVHLFPPSIL